jgi:hypothetical protein
MLVILTALKKARNKEAINELIDKRKLAEKGKSAISKAFLRAIKIARFLFIICQ